MNSAVQHASPDEVFEVIKGASSQDPAQIQASTARLKDLVAMPGAYDALQAIAAQRTLPLPIRQQAIIQFKNQLSHWRSRKLLSDDHRVKIRARCQTFLDEEDETIADCNVIIVSKIARNDFPTQWPTLVDDIMARLDSYLNQRYQTQSADETHFLPLRRCLQVLNGILKEFSTYKMLNGVRVMGQLFARLHVVLHGYYTRISSIFDPQTITSGIQTNSIRVSNDILLANLVYKCLSKMAGWMWQRFERDPTEKAQHEPLGKSFVVQLFQQSAVHLRQLCELRLNLIGSGLTTANPQAKVSAVLLTKHVLLLGKFFRRLSHTSHPRFVQLPMCSDMVLFYWDQVVQATGGQPELIADSNEVPYPIHNLSQWAPLRKDGSVNANSLSQDFVQTAVRLIVTRFLPLNPKDIENWVADPEEWMNLEDKENEHWEYEIRACSERVLVSLAKEFTNYVTPLLMDIYKDYAVRPSTDLSSVLHKEAFYCALGRCCIRLKDAVPFEDWLRATLSSEARDTNPNFPIIKRRIAWLIGKWVLEGCAAPNNPLVWETLGYLMTDRQQGTDVVVRLTAAVAMGECVKAIEFEPEGFEGFLGPTVTQLVALMSEADTLDSKRRVDEALNIVIDASESRMIPFIDIVTGPLPGLWGDAGEDWLFKSSLITTVTTLVTAIKEQSTGLGLTIVPLIQETLTPSARTNLDEQGLKLWSTALRNVTTAESVNGAPPLLELFPKLLEILGSNFDLLGTAVDILESYLLLHCNYILQVGALPVFEAFMLCFKSDAPQVNLKCLLRALNLIFQTSGSALWGAPLFDSGLFAYLVNTLLLNKETPILLTEHILLLSRIVLADREIFLRLIAATASAQGVSENTLYTGLLDQWWGKFDNMSEPRARKLCAMGMAALVSTGRPEVLERLSGEIFNMWMDVFGEIKEAQVGWNASSTDDDTPVSPNNLQRHWELDLAPHEWFQNTENTAEFHRRKAVYDADPVRTTQLTSFVAQRLQEAEAVCGQQSFQSLYLSQADPLVLQQIQAELRST
ncbi:armadillo-type protein [Mycena floridula]|nr:armadillo-type protein [Mycena floridula]